MSPAALTDDDVMRELIESQRCEIERLRECALSATTLRTLLQEARAEIEQLTGQRDELLAALRELDAILDFGAVFERCDCFHDTGGLSRAAEMARAAIAKAEGRPT
jgi:hypothetical protein